MQSLSKENIRHLKEVVLPSEGVQNLISRNMDELLTIAAADKREQLKVFIRRIARFGNCCKDPQWHQLDRYLESRNRFNHPQWHELDRYLESRNRCNHPQGQCCRVKMEITPPQQLKEKPEMVMQQLISLVQHTTELYHELRALDRLDEDYRRKLQEVDNSNSSQRVSTNCMGDNLAILRAELKSQRKLVRNLKKKSLWPKKLEKVVLKLVYVARFLYLLICETFGSADSDWQVNGSQGNHKELGSAGLALHFANVISQIDTLTCHSSCVPPKTRDALYQSLPRSIKSGLRKKLRSFEVKEELTVPQIKAEMKKTLQWLVPMATNTRKAHNGFGWVGEWASTWGKFNSKAAGQTVLSRVETLHHADKEKTEAYMLELLVWLHHLVSQAIIFNGEITHPLTSLIPSEIKPFQTLDVIDGVDKIIQAS
ncbi:hypothetical protein L6164_007472 [Bauhinia variegata]|uniref:Uncharacterized protein n=1 Tax=Bauhinia variegata TaxID=167791 RepID=A0ACB9PCN9_BAUVA|nr:hypothetical protein L6164_007472 [Bauhinia variegata]